MMDGEAQQPDTASAAGEPTASRGLLHRYWFDIALWQRTAPSLLLGIHAGLAMGGASEHGRWIGDIFVRLTRMLVAPLVFFTITTGVIALGDPRKLGSLGARTLGLFVFTAGLAATLGLTIALLLQPGIGVDVAGATPTA